MRTVLRTLRGYLFWTYERGSFHYDVMVTLILLFLFLSPHLLDYKARPVTAIPLRSSEVLVREQGSDADGARFLYEIRVEDLHGATGDPALRSAILAVVEPIAGNVTVERYAPVTDTRGRIVAYDATITR